MVHLRVPIFLPMSAFLQNWPALGVLGAASAMAGMAARAVVSNADVMSRRARMASVWLVVVVAATAGPATEQAQAGGTENALGVLERIVVQNEHRGGYDRALFPHWLDLDGNGCSARVDVLRRDSIRPVGADCSTAGGEWVSAYDGLTSGDPAAFEIDHVVALKEAWDSGAWAWPASRRAAFANDLSDPRTLRAVSSAANGAKRDADPSNWLPRLDRCRFLGDWVAIKARWGLSADQSEWGRIRNLLNGECAGLQVAVAPNVPGLVLPKTSAPATVAGSSVPPAAGFASCKAARAAGAAPLRRGDPGWKPSLDRDGDGVACE